MLASLGKKILFHHILAFHSPRPDSPLRIGRPRSLSFSYILDRVFFLLSSGCQWSRLPVLDGSWKTVYHYFSLWSKNHLFQLAYHDLLRVYFKIRPRSSSFIVDTSFVKNVFGHVCIGPSPFDRGRNATKVSTIVDSRGIPLGFTFHKGNRNDSRTLQHTLSNCRSFLLPGDRLYADKIYDSSHCRQVISDHDLVNCVSKKKQITSRQDNRTRIVVEHTFGWLDKYRRIIMRYDGHIHTFRSFHFLASLNLLGMRLINT